MKEIAGKNEFSLKMPNYFLKNIFTQLKFENFSKSLAEFFLKMFSMHLILLNFWYFSLFESYWSRFENFSAQIYAIIFIIKEIQYFLMKILIKFSL